METMLKKGTISQIMAVIPGILMAVPIFYTVYIVFKYGVNCPYWDEWDIVRLYHDFCENGFSLGKLLSFQVLEHRIPVAVAEQMLIWLLTDMNDYVVMAISLCLILCTFALIALYWYRRGLPIWGLIPVPVLLFSLKQAFTLLWPSCNMWFLMEFFSVASFFCYWELLSNGKKKWLLLSVVCAVLAMFSTGNGVLIWIAYFVFILIRKMFEGIPFFKCDNLCILLTGCLCFGIYFFGWKPGIASLSCVKTVRQFIFTLFPMVGCVFFESAHLRIALIFGILLIGMLIALGCYFCVRGITKHERLLTEYSFPLLVCIFFFGSMLCISYERGSIVPFSPGGVICLNSWYAIPSVCFMVGAYLLIYEVSRGRILLLLHSKNAASFKAALMVTPWLLFAVFFICSVSKIGNNVIPRALVYQKCAYQVQHYNDSLSTQESGLKFVYLENVSEDVIWLQENHLSLFSKGAGVEKKLQDLVQCRVVGNPTVGLQSAKESRSFWIDHINGTNWSDVTTAKTTGGILFSGWAQDDVNQVKPDGLYCLFRDRYYQLFINQGTVSPMCGFEGWLPLEDCPDGNYPLDIIIVCDRGTSYYQCQITTVVVGNSPKNAEVLQKPLQPEVADPTEGLSPVQKPRTVWVDTINGAEPAANAPVTKENGFSISGWALDDAMECAPQAVYLQFGDQYYQLHQTDRGDVCEYYFGNRNSPMCGFNGTLSLENYTPGAYKASLVIVCENGTAYYRSSLADVTVSAP